MEQRMDRGAAEALLDEQFRDAESVFREYFRSLPSRRE
jgi:hypothetical protein